MIDLLRHEEQYLGGTLNAIHERRKSDWLQSPAPGRLGNVLMLDCTYVMVQGKAWEAKNNGGKNHAEGIQFLPAVRGEQRQRDSRCSRRLCSAEQGVVVVGGRRRWGESIVWVENAQYVMAPLQVSGKSTENQRGLGTYEESLNVLLM